MIRDLCHLSLGPDGPGSVEDKAQKNQKEQISPFTGRAKCFASCLLSSVEGENQMEEEGSQFSSPGQFRWASLPSLCPCQQHQHQAPSELGSVGSLWASCAGSSSLDICSTYTAIFTSKALPGGCVFSPCSRTGLAVPSCCWPDLSLKLELVQSVLLTLKSGTYIPAQNSSSSHCSHFPELGEEWEQLQVAMAPGVGAGDIPGARASFVTLTATIRVPTWLNWVLTSRSKIPLGITASQHGTIIGLTSFSVYISSSSCLRCMHQYLLE